MILDALSLRWWHRPSRYAAFGKNSKWTTPRHRLRVHQIPESGYLCQKGAEGYPRKVQRVPERWRIKDIFMASRCNNRDICNRRRKRRRHRRQLEQFYAATRCHSTFRRRKCIETDAETTFLESGKNRCLTQMCSTSCFHHWNLGPWDGHSSGIPMIYRSAYTNKNPPTPPKNPTLKKTLSTPKKTQK